jgi:hypothetical protein
MHRVRSPGRLRPAAAGRRDSRSSAPALAVCLLLALAASGGGCGGGGGGGGDGGGPIGQGAALTVQVTSTVLEPDVSAFGLNISKPATGGAVQMLRNIVPNPGFEAGTMQMILHLEAGSTATRFVQDTWDTSWNDDAEGFGQPAGHWDGAEYEILSGPAKGRTGTITSHTHESGRNVFYPDGGGSTPATSDAVVVRKDLPGLLATSSSASADPTDPRPGSPGLQSMRLAPVNGASWAQDFDVFWRDVLPDAGKLRIIEGNWHLEFWARAAVAGDRLRIRFKRSGETLFFNETVSLGTTWQRLEFDTFVAAGEDPLGPYSLSGDHPALVLELTLLDGGGDVWVDDMVLERSDDVNPTAFTDPFVDQLKDFGPSRLRFNSIQYGGSLDNTLAVTHARRRTSWAPAVREGKLFTFGLHEFLELCEEVGADPWYCVPSTWPAEELSGLIDYLAAPADGSTPYADLRASLGRVAPWTDLFGTTHLEFGNELWGSSTQSDVFWGLTLRGSERLGEVAHDRFGILRANPWFEASEFDLVIGGHFGDVDTVIEIEAGSSNHDTIAMAPYYGQMDVFATEEQRYQPLFARALEDVATGGMAQAQAWIDVAGKGTQLAVYELNFRDSWSAPAETVNPVVSGQGGGLTLPFYMLTYLRDAGLRTQMAFTALGFGNRQDSGSVLRLQGLLRDVEATGRRRPTWLGLELANLALRGDLVQTNHAGTIEGWYQTGYNGVETSFDVPYVHSFAFEDDGARRLVLFNLNLTEAVDVTLDLPSPPVGPATRSVLRAADIELDNEDDDLVQILSWTEDGFADGFTLTLEPHSMEVIEWL